MGTWWLTCGLILMGNPFPAPAPGLRLPGPATDVRNCSVLNCFLFLFCNALQWLPVKTPTQSEATFIPGMHVVEAETKPNGWSQAVQGLNISSSTNYSLTLGQALPSLSLSFLINKTEILGHIP